MSTALGILFLLVYNIVPILVGVAVIGLSLFGVCVVIDIITALFGNR